MKILVAIKRVIDYNVRIRVRADGSGVEAQGVKHGINPFDEIALEEAIRLKEKGIATEVIALAIGTPEAQEQLRASLAMGADRAILITSDIVLQPLQAARILKMMIEREQPQLVLMGKQAIDDDCNQTGQMLAGLLNWPQATFASKLEINGNQAHITREVDGGLMVVECALPMVVTADLRLNQPRYPSLPNIMKAKSRPLSTLAAAELGIDFTPQLRVLKVEEPAKRKGGIKVKDVAELVDKLKTEARVL